MSFLDWLRSRASRRSAPTPRAHLAANREMTITDPEQLRRFMTGEGSVGHLSDADAMRVGAVYRAVQILTGALARMPVKVRQRVGPARFEPRDDHPVHALLNRRPNRFQKPFQARRLIANHLIFRGNSYWRIVRGSRGVQEILPLHPDRVEVRQRDDLTLEYRHITRRGAERIYPQEDILHVMGVSHDGITGVSPIEHARLSAGLSLSAGRLAANLYQNGAQVSSVLKIKGALSDEARANIERGLAKFRNGDRAGGTLILEEEAEFKPVGMTLNDARVIEMMNTEIAMFFGVPPHMLGDTEKSTSFGAGIEQQTIGFAIYTLGDWVAALEDAFTADLIGDAEPDLTVVLDSDSLMKLDQKSQALRSQTNLQWGIMSPDEVRAEMGLNPREDGRGGVYYPPTNMTDTASIEEPENDDSGQTSE